MKTITITSKAKMHAYADAAWAQLVLCYQNVPGGLLFSSKAHLIASTDRWRLSLANGVVTAVTIFKKKSGWKLVAMAKAATERSKEALIRLIRSDLKRCWMELSGAAERFVRKYCGGENYLIPSHLITRLLGKTITPLAEDNFYYQREIHTMVKTKIALGSPTLA